MKRTGLFLVLLLLLVWLFGASSRETISFVSVDWEPYAAEYLPGKGLTVAILAEASRRAGYDATFTFHPWKRAMEEVAVGEFDALFSAYYPEERASPYALSIPYLHGPLVFCVKAGSPVAYDGTLESLKPYRIGVVSGYVNTKQFDEAEFLTKDPAGSDLQNLKKLLGGRVDVIVIDKYVAIQLLKTNATVEAGLSDVRFLDPPLENKPLYAMFSKRRQGYQVKLEALDGALRSMQQDGTVKEILSRYGFEPGDGR